MQEILEKVMKRIDSLEKKVERYYMLLKMENELDFILKGSYLLTEDVDKIVEGRY